jgi:methylglutaconyl-CoA hydratase
MTGKQIGSEDDDGVVSVRHGCKAIVSRSWLLGIPIMTSEPHFLTEKRGAIAIFQIARPDQANAMSREVLMGLGQFARASGADAAVRALLVTGSGRRCFCAGADLKERARWSEDQVREQLSLYRTELGAVDECPKPVVAAINGATLGGGLEIALACDLRVAVGYATFAQPEVSLGIIPGAGGTQRLPRVIGEARAKEMILLGRRLSAQEALSWGLINRVTADGADVIADAIGWIEPITSGAPIAQCAALEAIDASAQRQLQSGLEEERRAYERVLTTEDRLEGILAFSEKRRPAFRGR